MVEPAPTIWLADDGAVHADWLSHYAMRFARRSRERMVHLLHVPEPNALAADILARRAALAKRYGVALEARELPTGGDVAARLVAAVPKGPDHLLIAGMRARAGRRGVLAGTVAAQLLASGERSVLALRVVQPGLLGLPGHAAVALSERIGLLERLTPGLRCLLPDLDRLTLVRVMATDPGLLARLSGASHAERLQEALVWLDGIAAGLRREHGEALPDLDTRAAVAADWPGQVLIEAARARANLLLVGSSATSVPLRFDASNPLERLVRDAPCDVAIARRGGPM